MLNFLNTDTAAILKETKGHFEGASNRTLYPAQVENLLLHTLAYRETLLRSDIQWCAEQNLVAYAIDEHLDKLGDLVGCRRLEPACAETKVRFTLDEPSVGGRVFPAGSRVSTQDGKVAFETLIPAFVLNGQTTSGIVTARCTVPGVQGNGLDAGVVCCLDPKISGVSVSSVEATDGGADLESDDAYRTRLLLAPAKMGCGGSRSAYRAWALEASALVVDAWAERGQNRGDINVYILSTEDELSDALREKVQETLMRSDVRLINDDVFVLPAVRRGYTIRAEITVFDNYDPLAALEQATAHAHEYARRQRLSLGRDVTPTQILMALSPMGERLYHVNLLEPSGILEIGVNEWPCADEIEITLAGTINE